MKSKVVYGGGGFLYALGVIAVVFMSGVATLGNYFIPKSQFDVGSKATLEPASFNHYWVPTLETPDILSMDIQPATKFLEQQYRPGSECNANLAESLMAEANVSFNAPVGDDQNLVCQVLSLKGSHFYFISQRTLDNQFLLTKSPATTSTAQVVLRTAAKYPMNIMRVKGNSQEIVVLQEGENNPAKTLVIRPR